MVPDIGNEDLRAQIKTLQYELESFKQEREFANLRHEKELRDAQIKAEADFRKAQVRCESKVLGSKADTVPKGFGEQQACREPQI